MGRSRIGALDPGGTLRRRCRWCGDAANPRPGTPSMPTARALALALATTGLAAPPLAAQDRPADSSVRAIQAHINEPRRLEPTDERIGRLKLPDGFRIEKFAEGLENPRMIAVAD